MSGLPVKRRQTKKREDLSAEQEAWLLGYAPRIAIGTYPDCYYDGQLPEARRRLGGVGTPCHECLAHVPHFSYGLPTSWVSQRDVEHYTGTARHIDGNSYKSQTVRHV
jgi:hypothetical protein